jgi:HK97 family phage prohead protease
MPKNISQEIGPEIRAFDFDILEIRAASKDEGKKIRGHAAVFDKLSEDFGGFRETIDVGAFTDAIKRDDVRALVNHVPTYILGRNKAGTLALSEDEKGLAIEISPPDTQYARDLMVSIERRDISQMSFAFNIDGKAGEKWEVDGAEVKPVEAFMAMFDGKKHDIRRHVVKVRLYDVSPVTFPAYPTTDVKVRDYLEALKEEAKAELDKLGPPRTGADVSLVKQRLTYGYPRK